MVKTAQKTIGRVEFVALAAMMYAAIAFSTDAMLPAFPQIAEELSPDAPNRVLLILTLFITGLGIGTFIAGPLSDRFGRKPIMALGASIYCLGAGMSWISGSLELVLLGRVIQGVGAAGPRVVITAVVRDLYSGRDMARMMSFIMMVFTLVPAIAPLLGSGIVAISSWRGIFFAYMAFAALIIVFMTLRLPETLPPEKRISVGPKALVLATREVFSYQVTMLSMITLSLVLGAMFSLLSMVQPVYDSGFGRGDSFAYWFAAIALFSGLSPALNAALVMRFGMRQLVTIAFVTQVCVSGTMSVLCLIPMDNDLLFAFFVCWQVTVFFQVGMTMGNLNALAMEPVGHIAGLAASIVGGISTVVGAGIAMLAGASFDGNPLLLTATVFVLSCLSCLVMLKMRKLELASGKALA